MRRNDIVREDAEDILERFLEEYLLRIYVHRGLFRKPFVPSRRRTSKTKVPNEERAQQLPTFKHEGAEYSDEDNYKMSLNSRFYSQEPVPGQLLYPPVSPRFQPIAKLYTSGQVTNVPKRRLVSPLASFINNTIVNPDARIKNILRMNSTGSAGNEIREKRIKFSKNSGYLNKNSLSHGPGATINGV
ncbi:uncharacterized protein LOC129773700 [Toxorhynchites rutilus septentrionalis]|uniref:uncharacterized protein LOC129773700 n=1 Tax=Toxorhynchites rutilus septentrionalis TaxID=329112 RepID=UPI002478D4CB|nr:uncharacterized protein LOC129773700 [Toxorhynchites rutilus septentrionalis]